MAREKSEALISGEREKLGEVGVTKEERRGLKSSTSSMSHARLAKQVSRGKSVRLSGGLVGSKKARRVERKSKKATKG